MWNCRQHYLQYLYKCFYGRDWKISESKVSKTLKTVIELDKESTVGENVENIDYAIDFLNWLIFFSKEVCFCNRKITEVTQIKKDKVSTNRDGRYKITKVYNLIST